MKITKKQQLLDISTLDELATITGEYPVPYLAEVGWFFLLKGRKISGADLPHARYAYAEHIRLSKILESYS